MSAVVSLPFRQPGTSMPVLPGDRFNLETLQGFTRFRLPGGSDVIAMADGILSVRTTPASLPPALILRPLLPHRLTDQMPERFATLRLLGIEQFIYTGLPLRDVSETACFTWSGTTRGVARRVVRRGVRGRQAVRPVDFLEGRSAVRIGRGDVLFRSNSTLGVEFEVAVGLTAAEEPYVGDVMALLAWWNEAGMLANRPSVPNDFFTETRTRLEVIGPRSGDASSTLDCPETHVLLRRPPIDASLLPPELVRIGVGFTSQTRIIINTPRHEDRMYGELAERRGTRVLSISADPENPNQFTLDPLDWSRLPDDMVSRRFVDLELIRESANGRSGIGIRAFRPPPNPRGRGTIEERHPEEHAGLNATGFYEQSDADPDYDAWAMQVHSAGLYAIVWLQTRRALRRFELSGPPPARWPQPVIFSLRGRQIEPDLTGEVTAQLAVSFAPGGMDAVLTIEGRTLNFRRVSTTPRLSDNVINAINAENAQELKEVVAARQRVPLTRGQVRSLEALVPQVLEQIRAYFENEGNSVRQGVAATRVGSLIDNWFNLVPARIPDPRRLTPDAFHGQPLLARHLFVALLGRHNLEFGGSRRGSASAWLRLLLDEAGQAAVARPHLGLETDNRATQRFNYRWKFLSLFGPEFGGLIGGSVRGGLMRVERFTGDADTAPPIWGQTYGVFVGSGSAGFTLGRASIGEADLSWNVLTTFVEWLPADFPGTLTIVSTSAVFGFESETRPGFGSAVFISDRRRWVASGPADGTSANYGIQAGGQVQTRLVSILPIGVDASRPPDATLRGFFTPELAGGGFSGQPSIGFVTGEARLDVQGWLVLRSFIALHLAGMQDPTTEISIVGSASRLGADIDNQILSERRAENMRRAVEDILGPVPRARVLDVVAVGEHGPGSSPDPTSDEASARYVRMIVNGRETVRLR